MSDTPGPEISDQFGHCTECGKRLKLSDMINHLADVHGHDPESIRIEVGEVPPDRTPPAIDRVVDIQTSGLLWLINKSLLHPRGYALGYDPDTGDFHLYGDGQEAWSFVTKDHDPEHGIDEDELLLRVKALLP